MAGSEQVTMADVAEYARVSRSAVSAAFSDRATTAVIRDETRRRILAAAQELGYQPNILSRSFIKQRSFLIGLVGREAFFVFTLEAIKGIEEALESTDCSLLTYYHGDWADDQAKHLQKCVARRVDGLIIVSAPEQAGGPNHRTIKELQDRGVPVVQLGRRIFPNVPVAMASDRRIGYVAAKHLIEMGHRHIAHITYDGYLDEELPGTNVEAFERYSGYCQAMIEAGLEPQVFAFYRSEAGLGKNDYSKFCEIPARLLTTGSRKFTAATTFNDYTSIGMMHALSAMGLRVPDDISLVGCDNVEAATVNRPALTTLRPPMTTIGRAAAQMILEMMDGKSPEDAIFEAELLKRNSVRAIAN